MRYEVFGPRGGGPGKGFSEKRDSPKDHWAALTRARLERMNNELTQEELDAMTPWSLLPLDRMIKLGIANLIKKFQRR